MLSFLRSRYLDILASIYIYNEHRGYTGIDRVLEAVEARYPQETAFIAQLRKHRRDERQHYLMFRRYFELKGLTPLAVDCTCGHIDRFIRLMFGCGIDDLDTEAVMTDPELFFRLCRVIMLTEQRGMTQVDILLAMPVIRSERLLSKIFNKIRLDEPSHWQPYQAWLERKGGRLPGVWERLADAWIHRSLILFKLPLLFLNPFLPRRRTWYDEREAAPPAAAQAGGR